MDLEHAAHQVVDEVDLAAAQEVERDPIDHDRRAIFLENEILVRSVLGDEVGILKS